MVGFTALLLLVPLAATSTAVMVRRLGALTWRRLHRLVYLIAILGVLHYPWLAKVGVQGPYYYADVAWPSSSPSGSAMRCDGLARAPGTTAPGLAFAASPVCPSLTTPLAPPASPLRPRLCYRDPRWLGR